MGNLGQLKASEPEADRMQNLNLKSEPNFARATGTATRTARRSSEGSRGQRVREVCFKTFTHLTP